MSILVYNNTKLAQSQSTLNYQMPGTNQLQTPVASPSSTNVSNPTEQKQTGFNNAKNQEEIKKFTTTLNQYSNAIKGDLLQIPSAIKFNPNLYAWVARVIDIAIRRNDNFIIWMLEKGLTVTAFIKNPYLATLVAAIEKYPDRFETIKLIANKFISRLQSIRGIRNIVGIINASKVSQYQKLVNEVPGLKRYNQATLEEFFVNRNSLPAKRQAEIAEKLSSSLSVGEKTAIQQITGTSIDDVVKIGANSSIYKQTAIKTFRSMETAMPKIAGFLEKAAPFLDVAISSKDFIDWLGVWKDTGWANMSDIDRSKLMMSALKALATVCYFIPGLQPFAILINTVIAIIQSVGIDAAENLGYAFGGMGIVGGKERMEKIQQVSESEAGFEPKDPMINAIYKLIMGWIKNDIYNNPNAQKGKNLRQFIDQYVDKYYNQQKDKYQVNWMKNSSDPKTLELYNALSMVLKNLKKANSSYNNRRYTICPSI